VFSCTGCKSALYCSQGFFDGFCLNFSCLICSCVQIVKAKTGQNTRRAANLEEQSPSLMRVKFATRFFFPTLPSCLTNVLFVSQIVDKLLTCSVCKSRFFCSAECQRADWKVKESSKNVFFFFAHRFVDSQDRMQESKLKKTPREKRVQMCFLIVLLFEGGKQEIKKKKKIQIVFFQEKN
jgi:hypothetical protein